MILCNHFGKDIDMIKALTEQEIICLKPVYCKAFDRSRNVLDYYPHFDEYIKFSIDQGYAFAAYNESNETVGFITGYEIPDMMYEKTIYVELLAVIPEEQNKGFGKALLREMESAARNKGIKEMALRTACYMDSYLIYRHLGFIDQRSDSRYLTKKIISK